MRTIELLKEENEAVIERFELSMERIRQIKQEETVKEPYRTFFIKTANLIELIAKTAKEAGSKKLRTKREEELKQLNQDLYQDILPEFYEHSYANPDYAVYCFGTEYGHIFTFLITEIRSLIPCAFEYKLFDITVAIELFIEIYNALEEETTHTYQEIKQAIYYYAHDYSEDFSLHSMREQMDTTYTFARDIIMEEDLCDLKYLYYYGEYITENERKIADYLNKLPQEQVCAIADTYVDGYIRGFETMRVDFSKKSIIGIRFCIGFERIIKYAVKRFEEMGKHVAIQRAAVPGGVYNANVGRKAGYYAVSPNPQYEYDHRFDNALFFDKKIKEVMLSAKRNSLERYKVETAQYAGPAVLEAFGEPDFEPISKETAIKQEEYQKKLMMELRRDSSILSLEYLNPEETSFTIIAYPLPSIGDKFEEIFAETVKVNTLDNDTYKEIQQKIIDTLDKGTKVHILGADKNCTDLTIQLHELKNPDKETNFENCTADVNIPVGEVFTSPVLHGTNGTLYVSEVYLHGLAYKDLKLTFKDGMIVSYECSNFGDSKQAKEIEEKNQTFLKENLLMNHSTLPIGEFAIGTNTTAYVMANKYKIQRKLPTLIAEKTGPHFAVGDTCYKMSEEHKVYNPDGKEIIARENECSALRTTDIEKAYFNCHTDITIPYNEIKEISSVTKDGDKAVIIKDGRFVLEGTELLNQAFDNISI